MALGLLGLILKHLSQLFVANVLSLLVAFTYQVVISLYLTYWLYIKNQEISSIAATLYASPCPSLHLLGGGILIDHFLALQIQIFVWSLHCPWSNEHQWVYCALVARRAAFLSLLSKNHRK